MKTGSPRIYVSRAKALPAKKGDKGYGDKNDSLAGKGLSWANSRPKVFYAPYQRTEGGGYKDSS